MYNPKGFSVGPANTNDVPDIHCTCISNDSKLIWDVLMNAFDTNSVEQSIVGIYNGQGYKALYNIASQNHPALIPEPSKLVLHRPTQRDLSLVKYWNKYSHYLMLCSFIKN